MSFALFPIQSRLYRFSFRTYFMKLRDIAEKLNARLDPPDAELEITDVEPIESATPGQITFIANPKYAAVRLCARLGTISSAAAICPGDSFLCCDRSFSADRRECVHWSLRGHWAGSCYR